MTSLERGKIVGERLVYASVKYSHVIRGIERNSNKGLNYTTLRRTSEAKNNSGQKNKLTERDLRDLRKLLPKLTIPGQQG